MKRDNPYELEFQASQRYVRGERIPLKSLVVLAAKATLQLFEMMIRYIPGPFGYKLRYYYYKPLLKHLGKGVLIDVGVYLNGTKNISIGEYSWIDVD